MKPKIIAVIGPTASGKSNLAIQIAQDFNGEIISADSRQFYRGMDIGTAKVLIEDRQKAPHHMIDILEPNEPFSLYIFQKKAYAIIDDILKRGKLPILVGGTGLYVSSIVDNYKLTEVEVDRELRDELNKKDLNTLVVQLKKINPDTKIELQNKRRVVRELERLLTDEGYVSSVDEPRFDVMIIQPHFEREALYQRINSRVDDMIKNGLLKEIDVLVDKYGWEAEALKTAIGYREFYGLNDVELLPADQLDSIIELIKQHSRNYAKRQITWFKRYDGRILDLIDYKTTQKELAKFAQN